jgi:hypothetical protein
MASKCDTESHLNCVTVIECDVPVIVEFNETESIFERNLTNSSVTSNQLFDVTFSCTIVQTADVNSRHLCSKTTPIFVDFLNSRKKLRSL